MPNTSEDMIKNINKLNSQIFLKYIITEKEAYRVFDITTIIKLTYATGFPAKERPGEVIIASLLLKKKLLKCLYSLFFRFTY